MKELMEFLKANNGAFYFDKEGGRFVLCTEQQVKFTEDTVYCPFCGDNDIIPDNAWKEWVEPAIKAIERFGK